MEETQEGRILALATPYETSTLTFIGSGGFGSVYTATSRMDKKKYAIKRIPLRHSDMISVIKEVRILAHLDHPHVVRYYAAWADNGGGDIIDEDEFTIQRYYCNIRMELCACNLRHLLEKRYFHEKKEYSQELFSQIVSGLMYIHGQGIVHCDLKPENILISHDGIIKLSDFGISRIVAKSHALMSSFDGLLSITDDIHSGPYTAPESGDINFPADVYSLGIILVEMLSSFSTRMEFFVVIKNLIESRIAPSSLGPYESTLVMLMTESDPSKRPPLQLISHAYHPSDLSDSLCRDIVWGVVARVLYTV